MYSLEQNLPSITKLKNKSGYKDFLVIIDTKLLKDRVINSWLKNFKAVYAVKAGEDLKSISHLEKHLNKILKLKEFQKETAIISIGGGSVGDFAGFIASILRRGVGLVHIPTTWLAAIDSSHGGKTALNVNTYKNQIGSFYPAHHVFLTKSILLKIKNKKLLLSALGELYKMALLEGGKFYKDVQNMNFSKMPPEKMSKILFRFLKPAVEAKYKVVKKDPLDKGYRHILNLGHTMGHAIELNNKIDHGIAVAMGLKFSVKWGTKGNKDILNFLDTNFGDKNYQLTGKKIELALLKDKKRAAKKITFVFVDTPGKPVLKSVTAGQIVKEAKRQGLF